MKNKKTQKLFLGITFVLILIGLVGTANTALISSAETAPITSPPGGGGSDEQPGDCDLNKPSSAPQLYQINAKNNRATLYFSPAGNPVSYYRIAYGYKNQEELFGVSFANSFSGGAASYTINHLHPNTVYYFKVRGGNKCKTGDWSNIMPAKTGNNKNFTWWEMLRKRMFNL